MAINYTLVMTWFLILIIVSCASADSEVKEISNTGLGLTNTPVSNKNNNVSEQAGIQDSGSDSNKVNPEKMGKDQVVGLKGVENINFNKDNPSKQLGSKGVQTGETNANGDDSVEGGGKKGKTGEGSKTRDMHKEGIVPPLRKESFRVEDCDSSKSCTDEKKALVACLRVQGNEPPDLSLLIQNKGKGPLSVTISAPDFVLLEKRPIQLQENESKEVVLPTRTGETENFIVLTAGNGNCSLDVRDLIAQNSRKETGYHSKTTSINIFNGTLSFGFICLAAIFIIASVWTCISFRRRRFARNGSKYQKLDMEQLPFSGHGKVELNSNDGWDNSWGDDWDDVEAPKTPSMPITPSLSSKRVTSRRSNKEGRKD
ncbi:unnamed protein product [Ilex paraguariensis]|uniref:DUF7356 domain-containing protein n=1 Tax=Ilex paraguariensis TaxID=185542 RepID=A0ABC8RMA3_9AQUA